MNLEDKIEPLKDLVPRVIFWLKPNGEDYCKAIYKENSRCMKSIFMMSKKYPIDCKFFEPNYDFPTLSKCYYKK